MRLAITARCENFALELPSGELLALDFPVAFDRADDHARGLVDFPRRPDSRHSLDILSLDILCCRVICSAKIPERNAKPDQFLGTPQICWYSLVKSKAVRTEPASDVFTS
jgi:hypothetical protein